MKKKLLAKIPIPTLSHTHDENLYSVGVQDIEVDGMPGLALNFFKKDGVCAERTFLLPDDYITQNFEDGPAWRTASLYYRWYETVDKAEFCSEADSSRVVAFLKGYVGDSIKSYRTHVAWSYILAYQDNIMAARLEKKYRREIDQIDRQQAVLHDLPDDFEEWVRKEALSKFQFVFYKRDGKNVHCKCSVCGKEYTVSLNQYRPEHRKEGVCHSCGKKVTFISDGKQKHTKVLRRDCAFVDPTPDGFCIRYFNAYRTIKKGGEILSFSAPEDEYSEVVRVFIRCDEHGKAVSGWEYWYTKFRNTEKVRWCNPQYGMFYQSSVHTPQFCTLYHRNLPDALPHTASRYNSMGLLSKLCPGEPAYYHCGLTGSEDETHTYEILIKSGFLRLARELMEGWNYYKLMNIYGNDLKSVLKLNTPKHPNAVYIKMLREVNAGFNHLHILQAADRAGVAMTAELLKRYETVFAGNEKYIAPRYRYNMPLADVCSFFEQLREERSKVHPSYSDLIRDWEDYQKWCRYLNVDLTDKYYCLPPVKDFYRFHDERCQEYEKVQEEEERKRIAALNEAMKERMKVTQEIITEVTKNMRSKDLFIKLPMDLNELKVEGEKLHHCVRTYIPKVAEGKTLILFIRRTNDPDTPYYTMEFKDGDVAQCRGYGNCSMRPDVQRFVDRFKREFRKVVKEKELA